MKDTLTAVLTNYPVLAPAIFIIVRASAIVLPPIPGIVIDLVGIAVFPWFLGFVYGEIGIMLGAIIAFLVARNFREPFIKRFVPLNKINSWEEKLSSDQEFWFLVGLRLFFNPLFDYVSYAAGLTKISTSKYLLTTVIGTIPTMLAIYYFGNISITKGVYFSLGFILLLFIGWWGYKKFYMTKHI